MNTFTCLGCGRLTVDDESGCYACDICQDCTPLNGNCLDCADQRREHEAEAAWIYAIENEVCS